METPYKRGIPGHCHRWQLYGHAAANCHAQPRCVKCFVPHWTKDCDRTKETGAEKCNCIERQDIDSSQFPPLNQARNVHTSGEGAKASPRVASGDEFRPAPPSKINLWKKLPPRVTWQQQFKETTVRESTKSSSLSTGTTACAFGEDINIIMLIFQEAKRVEVAELASKFRKAKHRVDRLRIIMENQEVINKNGREMEVLAEDLYFNIVTPLTPTHYPNDDNRIPDILDIAFIKEVAMKEINISILNSIPHNIISTDDIDNAIGVLTNHISTVVDNSSQVVPANSGRKKLPRDVNELIRAKNAALKKASKYPMCENRSYTRVFQRKVKARMQEVRNDNWSDLMVESSPSHKAYWRLAKALKTEGASPNPALREPDNSIAFDDQEKAEVEEEVRRRVSLLPKDDLNPITLDKTSSETRVPQGYTLSPLLYSAYGNDIPRPRTGV
ncbi:hypothetical protein EVAR_367_1 [Eumeta japonica]|uniref:Uncharacterized protein n=1 Tax=Eumeta variegata TaxID=151549 RepID=A0A4C1SA34_EUMVA|nr:hypothetical protein EVAR_367_1 [Eumeta japonica]